MKKIKIEDFQNIFNNREPRMIGNYSYYSVLVPLVEKDDELFILYEVRADSLDKQPGEVCFPGGRVEPGETVEECAIRETQEELNIPVQDIKVIAQLDYLHTYRNFTIYSFLGVIDHEVLKNAIVSADEVKEVFLVPLSFLLETKPDIYELDIVPDGTDGFPYERINAKGYNWRKGKYTVPIYEYENKVIWGLTGRITENLMEIINKR